MSFDLKRYVRMAEDADKIVTPRLQSWLLRHGDEGVPENVANLIYAQMVAQPRYRGESFSSSSAGMCLRRQVLMYLNMPQGSVDPQLQNIFNDGKWRHMRWQAMLLTAGILDRMEFSLPWPNKRSVGTMDGLGVVPDDHPRVEWRGKVFGFELKGVSTFQYGNYAKKGARPKDDHLNQVHRYFLSSGVDLFVIIYEDKTTQAWTEWVIEPEPALVKEQKVELNELNRAVDREELPPMLPDCKRHTGAEWRSCPFGGSGGICESAGLWPAEKLLERAMRK